MKLLCKKNHKHFKKDKWYSAFSYEIKFSKNGQYSNSLNPDYEIRSVYLVGGFMFYEEKSKYSKIGKNILSDYFYTEQELRKEKLKKLKK